MPNVKKAPVTKFEEYIKKAISSIENIRTKQEEKQAVIDEYGKQHKRYAEGRISRRAFQIAVSKNKKLLLSLDKQIKRNMTSAKSSLKKALNVTEKQRPLNFKTTMEGLTNPAKKVIKRVRKRVTGKKRKKK